MVSSTVSLRHLRKLSPVRLCCSPHTADDKNKAAATYLHGYLSLYAWEWLLPIGTLCQLVMSRYTRDIPGQIGSLSVYMIRKLKTNKRPKYFTISSVKLGSCLRMLLYSH